MTILIMLKVSQEKAAKTAGMFLNTLRISLSRAWVLTPDCAAILLIYIKNVENKIQGFCYKAEQTKKITKLKVRNPHDDTDELLLWYD